MLIELPNQSYQHNLELHMQKTPSQTAAELNKLAKDHTFVVGLKKDAKSLKKTSNISLHTAQTTLLNKVGLSSLSELYLRLSGRIQHYLENSFFSFTKNTSSIKAGIHEINREAFMSPDNILHIFTVGFELQKHFQELPVIKITDFVYEKYSVPTYILITSLDEIAQHKKLIKSILMQGRSLNVRLLIALPTFDANFDYSIIFANINVLIVPKDVAAQITSIKKITLEDPLTKYCPFVAYTRTVGYPSRVNIDFLLKA